MRPSDYVRKGWCKHSLARDTNGRSILPTEPQAVCWCLMGACVASGIDLSPTSVDRERLHLETGEQGLSYFNDYVATSKQDVIEVLERCGL